MDKQRYEARAKVNLGLDVCRRLENGYHEVKMVMQTVDLYDELTFQKREDQEINLMVDSQDTLGDMKQNLIYKAAKLMQESFLLTKGVDISLKKNIPVAAGMAGGSTDAAATLIAINDLFELGQTKEQLMELGVKLGADVPYCILGGTALAEGIGEKLTVLPTPEQAVVLIAKPDLMVSTKDVYENLHVETLKKHPDIDGMVDALKINDFSGVINRMENVLEHVTISLYPIIEQIKQFMKECGAKNALMSGSGPTVFGIYDTVEEAQKAAELLKQTGMAKQIHVTRLYNER